MADAVSRILTDIRPLQSSADYRRLWAGNTISQLGQQMTAVTVAIQVWALTHSTFAVELVGLFALGPLIVFGLYGGAVADVVDRRRVALVASGGLWVLSLALVLQAAVGLGSVPVLYVIVAVQSGCFAVNNPTRAAIVPRLISDDLLPAANALNLGGSSGAVCSPSVCSRRRRRSVRCWRSPSPAGSARSGGKGWQSLLPSPRTAPLYWRSAAGRFHGGGGWGTPDG